MTKDEPTSEERTPSCGIEPDVLWDLVDGLLSGDDHADVEQHVAACASCQPRIEKIRRVHSGLESITGTWQRPLPERIGPYRIQREIGAGGMGVVYEALQENPNRPVALKVVRPASGTDERRLRAFRREVQALGRMSHPAIAMVHDAGRSADGELYLVMELVAGETIDRDRDAQDLPTRGRVALVAELADAVHYAHERGVVHRDLKPANILVDEASRLRILDFGLARFLDPAQDVTMSPSAAAAAPSGTMPYMSPEQLAGHASSINAPTDVYALGVVLYQLLTGRLPYAMDSGLSEALRTVEETDPRHPSAILVGLPRELGDVVLKAIAKEPAHRYATAQALADDLRRFLAGQAVVARPPSLAYRFRVSARRHKSRVVVGTLLVTAVSVGALVRRDNAVMATPRTVISIPKAHLGFSIYGRQFDFSSDGARVVHASDPIGEILVWNRARGVSERIPIAAAKGWFFYSPRWSPDDRRIALLGTKNTKDNPSGGWWGVFVLDPTSSEITELRRVDTSSEQANDLCWTPDGQAVTFFTRASGIYTISLAREISHWTGRYPKGLRFLGGYSPDGRWLLVDVRDRKESAVWNIPAGGGRGIRLTDQPGYEQHSSYSPDSPVVYFVAAGATPGRQEPRGPMNAFQLAVDPRSGAPEGKPIQLTFGKSGEVHYPRIVGGARDLVFQFVQQGSFVCCATEDRFEEHLELTKGHDPIPGPDGETIYFTGASDDPGLFAIARRGGSKRKLADRIVGDLFVHRPDFDVSPDGQEVAYRTEDRGTFALCVVPTSGDGSPRVLDEFDEEPGVPRWSPDGKWIAFTIGGVIHVVSSRGERRKPIGAIWSWDWIEWSPKGDALAGLGYRTPEDEHVGAGRVALFVVQFPGGELQKVSKDPEYKEGFAWHPTGDFLSYYSYGSAASGPQIRFVYPKDGRDDPIDLPPNHAHYRFVWWPDGKRLLHHSMKKGERNAYHVWDLERRETTAHGVAGLDGADFPRFDRTGDVAVWEKQSSVRIHSFVVLHGRGR